MNDPFNELAMQLSRLVGDTNGYIVGGVPPTPLIRNDELGDSEWIEGSGRIEGVLSELAMTASSTQVGVLPYRPSLETLRTSFALDKAMLERGVRARNITNLLIRTILQKLRTTIGWTNSEENAECYRMSIYVF